MLCKRCSKEFTISMIPKEYVNSNPSLYEFCTYCRKYKKCGFCKKEFHHHQNQTCSKECTQKLKELSFLNSCGTSHNFYKDSSSRKKWEQKLLLEGYDNVFQREDVKEKCKETLIRKYGYDHISKSPEIKKIKSIKFKKFKKKNPNYFKDKWHKWHQIYLSTIGHDPRLNVFGKASKESLKIFLDLIDWCLLIGVDYNDIYLGIDGKSEFFLKDGTRIYFYDFTIRSRKLIIEFQGVAFHAKSSDDVWENPFTSETSLENINKRLNKHNFAIRNGYKILEIWSDACPTQNLEMCKKFIENEN